MLALKFCIFKKTSIYLRFEKANFLRFQIAIFKKCNSQTTHFLRLDLKSYFLTIKLQFQTQLAKQCVEKFASG
jgi:hypothetical protein